MGGVPSQRSLPSPAPVRPSALNSVRGQGLPRPGLHIPTGQAMYVVHTVTLGYRELLASPAGMSFIPIPWMDRSVLGKAFSHRRNQTNKQINKSQQTGQCEAVTLTCPPPPPSGTSASPVGRARQKEPVSWPARHGWALWAGPLGVWPPSPV